MRKETILKALALLPLLFWGLSPKLNAQPTPPVVEGLIAYYSFDNCDATDDTGGGSDGAILGDPGCVCGVSGNALEFDGLNDHVLFLGLVNSYFDTDNFSVSFYFKPFGSPLRQTILSKRETCGPDNAFEMFYTPNQNLVTADLSENNAKNTSTRATLNFDNCWHHVVMVRRGGRSILYIDGEFVSEETPSPNSRVDLDNNASLALAETPCIGAGVNRFKGYVDELAVYSVELSELQVRELYLNPDKILNDPVTNIYLGESVDIDASNTCAEDFSWSPTDGIDNPDSLNVVITPTVDTTYRLQFRDENNCIAYDTIRINVIDPDLLGCQEAFLPKAFSPNGVGPVENETFGISNYRALDELISFEIYDRWGGRVFFTDQLSGRWDGRFQGSELNPGVFLYKIKYDCNGETVEQFGSVTLIR